MRHSYNPSQYETNFMTYYKLEKLFVKTASTEIMLLRDSNDSLYHYYYNTATKLRTRHRPNVKFELNQMALNFLINL